MTQGILSAPALLYPSRPFVLHAEGGFRYFNASDVPAAEIVRLLAGSFAREPMAAALGVGAPELAGLIERFMPECRTNGLSVVAVPETSPDTLAAAFLSRDFKSRVPEGLAQDFPWFAPVGEALAHVGAAYEARHPGLAPGEAADLWMVGTDPRFAGRGIAARLFRICAELARENGFRRCVTECTGRYSQKAAERAGFTEVARLAYAAFRFEGGPLFAGVPAPHAHLAIYDRAL